MIEQTQPFNDWAFCDIEIFARYVQAYEAAPDTVIFKEGQHRSFMCLLLEGNVEIFKYDSGNENKFVGRIGPGKTVGEMALIDGELRSATCICPGTSKLAILTRGSFKRLLHDYPSVGAQLVMIIALLMSRRLRRASGQLVDFLED